MLVLTRKLGESIKIGSNIHVKVTNIAGGRVQIGIDAPREIAIRRSELSPDYVMLPAPPAELPVAG